MVISNRPLGGKKLPELSNPGDASDILSGVQFIDGDGEIVTGTMPTKGAQTYTPGTSNQTISSGRYLTGNQTIQGDSELVPGNIRSGVNIFGVNEKYRAVIRCAEFFNYGMFIGVVDTGEYFSFVNFLIHGNEAFHKTCCF